VAEPVLRSTLLRFPRTLGEVLVAPRRALREIDARERGGFSALVIWALLAAIGLRFTALADAVIGFEAGGGLRVVSVLVSELTEAVPVALVASLLVVIAAGGKREPSLDMELGCAAALPLLVTRAVFRSVVVLSGLEYPATWVLASYVVGGAWSLGLVALAVGVARRRPQPRPADPVAGTARIAARVAAWAALGVLGLALAGNVYWTVGNAQALGPLSRGQAAPEFTLPRVDGTPGALSLSSLRGRVVVLDFWATWCPPCLAALPTMHALAKELDSKGVTFVGVDSDGEQTPPAEVTAFLNEHGAPYPVVYDHGAVNRQYRIKVLPTVVIVGKTGTVERVFIGITSKSTLTSAIEAAAAR
jgi:thiol-disulfide isomerase/thioredoxin